MAFAYDSDDPIRYACDVLEAYESEIRGAIADGKLPSGFCQGVIFTKAREMVVLKAARAAVAGKAYAESAALPQIPIDRRPMWTDPKES